MIRPLDRLNLDHLKDKPKTSSAGIATATPRRSRAFAARCQQAARRGDAQIVALRAAYACAVVCGARLPISCRGPA